MSALELFLMALTLVGGIGLAQLLKPHLDRFLRRRLYADSRLSRSEVLELDAQHDEHRRLLDEVLAGRPGSAAGRQLKPILYLQGFALGGIGRLQWVDEENGSRIPVRMQMFLSLVAGRSHAQLIGIGGSVAEVIKLRRGDDEWRDSFRQLAEWVNVILARPFISESVLYELDYLLCQFPSKLVLIMDPVDSDADGVLSGDEREESWYSYRGDRLSPELVWAEVRKALSKRLTLPEYSTSGGFVAIESDGETLRARHHGLYPETLTRLIEERHGALLKMAELVVELPGGPGEAPRSIPWRLPIYDLSATPTDCERVVREVVASEARLADRRSTRLDAGDADLRHRTVATEVRFERWLSIEEAFMGEG